MVLAARAFPVIAEMLALASDGEYEHMFYREAYPLGSGYRPESDIVAAVSAGQVESSIRNVLAQTREANEHYSSSSYEETPGLGRRLATIEQALVELARQIDELGSSTGADG